MCFFLNDRKSRRAGDWTKLLVWLFMHACMSLSRWRSGPTHLWISKCSLTSMFQTFYFGTEVLCKVRVPWGQRVFPAVNYCAKQKIFRLRDWWASLTSFRVHNCKLVSATVPEQVWHLENNVEGWWWCVDQSVLKGDDACYCMALALAFTAETPLKHRLLCHRLCKAYSWWDIRGTW